MGCRDVVLADVFSQFLELGLGKFGARVVAVFVEQVDRHLRSRVWAVFSKWSWCLMLSPDCR
jgi:hypothetical protein